MSVTVPLSSAKLGWNPHPCGAGKAHHCRDTLCSNSSFTLFHLNHNNTEHMAAQQKNPKAILMRRATANKRCGEKVRELFYNFRSDRKILGR